MLSRRAFLLAGTGLVLAVGSARWPALAQAPDDVAAAKRLLETIYRAYLGDASRGLDYQSPQKARRYFSPDTARLYERDLRGAGGEGVRLDFDPFVNGQDWQVTAIDGVAVKPTGPDTARGTVTLTNLGRAQTIVHDLVRTAEGWRIHDITWAGSAISLRSVLSRPNV